MRRSSPKPRPRTRLLAGFAGGALVAASIVTGVTATTPDPESELSGTFRVSAAASLTDAYEELGTAFTAEHPDVEIEFNFGASSDLVTQITEGAPADVFASADVNNMTKLVDADALGGEPEPFATNSLTIAVEEGNPENITGLEDLAERSDLIVVSCDPEVPIGAYTQEVFANAGVEVEIDSFEENVRAVSSKVELGEADAGVVYATDVTAAGDSLDAVEIPAEFNVVAVYPIAVTAEAENPDAAVAFVEFVLDDDGQAILAEFGFGSPEDAPSATTVPADATTAPATTTA